MLISKTVSIGKVVCSEGKRLIATQRDLALSSGTGLRFIVDVEKGKPTCQSDKVLEVSNSLRLQLTIEHQLVSFFKDEC
jgi:HTH-type transcriptional regulator/antitoxin HipB